MCQILPPIPSPAADELPKQRDDKGRFAPGNSGGHGNPFGRRVAELRKAMLDAVSAVEIAAIIQALVLKAMSGDVQAAKVVLSYAIGKPEPAKDPDRIDVEEWALHKETLPMGKELIDVMNQPTPDMPLKMVNYTRSAIGFLQQKQLEEASDRKEKKSERAPSTDGSVAPLECGGSTPLSFFERSQTKKESGVQPPHSKEPPSTNGFSGEKLKLPKGSFKDVPPGMYEFYQTLVERGFAPPIPEDDESR